jgi:hypothetical protein
MAGVGHAALTGAITGAVAGAMQKGCFLAGTSVTLGCGDMMAIESLVVGMRVLTPEGQQGATQVVPEHWRQYDVQLLDEESGWDRFDITLLRPVGWLQQHSRNSGTEVWLDLDELNAHGWAKVVQERACPVIAQGPGRVVTATITHRNDDVRTLTLDGGETLYVTGNHRMFSASARDWVPVKQLYVGEELRTSEGRKSVAALGYQKGRHQVYNIEVEEEHCYFVGEGRTLAHNMCGPDGGPLALTNSAKTASKRAEGTYKQLADAGLSDGHHIIQDAAVSKIPGYKSKAAPAVQLEGPSTLKGSEHYNATQLQRQPGGGTYGAERRIGYKALRGAGLSKGEARQQIARACY